MAEGIAASVGTNLVQRFVDGAMNEMKYLCCFKSYVDGYEKEKSRLLAMKESVDNDIKEAKEQNKTVMDSETQQWLKEAGDVIGVDTKVKKKKWFFGLCTNCIWQYSQGKELAKKTVEIQGLMERRSRLGRIARSAGRPGMEFYSLQGFMHFESRKARYEELKEALRSEDNQIIGLQGMGGTGKTTMATQVGKEVEESKLFDKVIFVIVSNPPDLKKIQSGIARNLGLQSDERDELEENAKILWSRIAKGEEKILIILDDVWQEINLHKDIGIPLRYDQKSRCCILLTTRDKSVCQKMGCQKTIELELLSEDEALNLFLWHAAGKSIDGASKKVRNMASKLVKQCGRLPVAIVAVAKSLNSKPMEDWEAAFVRLKHVDPLLHHVDEDLARAYRSLSLSIANLKNKESKELFLLSSLFPEDSEIRVEMLRRIAIGLGLFGEANEYYILKSRVRKIEKELIDSSLWLKANNNREKASNNRVKLHDLVREVAIKVANTRIQVVMDSKAILSEDTQYSYWNVDEFPNHFGGNKLELLIVWINAENFDNVPDAPFEGMTRLKVLLLSATSWENSNLLHPSLLQSIGSLRNIRTLILIFWKLGDISILRNLQLLESLEMTDCSFDTLPDSIIRLEKLRLLTLRGCYMGEGNPFKVIERCHQLEELYFSCNRYEYYKEDEDELHCIGTPLALKRYFLYLWCNLDTFPFVHPDDIEEIEDIEDYEDSMSRVLQVNLSENPLSEATMKSLVARAEFLYLEGDYHQAIWRNMILDIVSVEDGGLNELIKLYWSGMSKIECLVNTEHLQQGVTIFSNLVKLKLVDTNVRELCSGPFPVDFLKQLEKLHLEKCSKLEGVLFKGNFDLGKLKSIKLENCSMTSLFHPSTAQSLLQLETLKIVECDELKYIVTTGEGSEEEKVDYLNPNPSQRSLPKLKVLSVSCCNNLESILPIYFAEDTLQLEDVTLEFCKELKYLFGQHLDEGGSYEKEKNITLPSLQRMRIYEVPKFINIYPECYPPRSSIMQSSTTDPRPSHTFSWASICCFMGKSSAASVENPSTLEATQTHHAAPQPQILKTEMIFKPDKCLLKRPLNPQYMRKISITHCSNLTSLFTLPVASSMSLLEELNVKECRGLEQIVIDEGDGHDHVNYTSLFPNLRKVSVNNCGGLRESLFPTSHFGTFEHLEYLAISSAHELRNVFGKCYYEDNVPHENQKFEINLTALTHLSLRDVPNMVSICTENCHLTALSPKSIVLEKCPQLPIRPLIDLGVGRIERQGLTMRKEIDKRLEKLTELELSNTEIDIIYNLEGVPIEGRVTSSLKTMRLINLPSLSDICAGPPNILSLENLSHLIIQKCNKLRVIFYASILQSFPNLRSLEVLNCEELVQIIEETDLNPHLLKQKCFPKLWMIEISGCKSMKCLLPISTFGCKDGETKELKDVFPELDHLILTDLPDIDSVCRGIDFQKVRHYVVSQCPKISLASSTTMDHQDEDSKAQPATSTEELPLSQSEKEVINQVVEEPKASSLNLTKETMKASVQDDGPEIKDATVSDKQTLTSGKASQEPFVIPLQKESPQDTMIDDDAKKETTITGQQALEETTPKIKLSIGEGPSSVKNNKPTPSTRLESEITHLGSSTFTKEFDEKKSMDDKDVIGEGISTKEALGRVYEPLKNAQKIKESTNQPSEERSGENAVAVPPTIGQIMKDSTYAPVVSSSDDTSRLISSITSSEELPQTKTTTNNLEADGFDKIDSPQGQIIVNQSEIDNGEEIKIEHISPEEFEEDDLFKLFRVLEEGEDMEVGVPNVSKFVVVEDDNKVTKAFADLEASLKMSLNEIASSEENSLRLQNALSLLSAYCSEDGAPSHGLSATISSLQQEIQSILSSLKQASSSLHAFTELEEKEKRINEELPQRKKVAKTLLLEIRKTEKSKVEAQCKEAELKEHISRLQSEMNQKEKEIKECEIKLSSLQEQKKKSVSDTIGFVKEFEAVKKDKSQMVEEQMKARKELEKVDAKWSSCVANLKKTALLLGIHLNHKLQ